MSKRLKKSLFHFGEYRLSFSHKTERKKAPNRRLIPQENEGETAAVLENGDRRTGKEGER